MFIDEVKIYVKAGDGGNGCVSFRREKFVPRGGPDGGEGGRGGDVIIRAKKNIKTLIDFYYHPHYKAERGRHGEGKNKSGKSGQDLILEVPLGTSIYIAETNQFIIDMVSDGQEFLACRGGRGGKGNSSFATSVRQAPRFAQKGEAGEECHLRLELKLIADVGIIGFPNVGKSTLISRITDARPKIADYPFTTLSPNLGVVIGLPFIVADMPGLIPGAHKGLGLGDRFLRHTQRTKILLHMLDMSGWEGRNPIADYESIERELELYDIKLSNKKQIVVGNKIDIPEALAFVPEVKKYFKKKKMPFLTISAVTGEGLKELIKVVADTLRTGINEKL